MCEKVPNRWNIIAVNWITRIRAKKKTNTRPMGSSWRYSFDISTFGHKIVWRSHIVLHSQFVKIIALCTITEFSVNVLKLNCLSR
jgi:hypothetical protein